MENFLYVVLLVLVMYLAWRWESGKVTGIINTRCGNADCPCGGAVSRPQKERMPEVKCRQDYINYVTLTGDTFNAGVFNLLPNDEDVVIESCQVMMILDDGYEVLSLLGSNCADHWIANKWKYKTWYRSLDGLCGSVHYGIVDVKFLGRVQ